MMRRAVLYAACVLLLGSCIKAGSYDTTYVLKPGLQAQSVAASEPLDGVIAYAYEVDSLDWGIASYDDALAGVLTRKSNPGDHLTEPAAVAVPYDGAEPDPESGETGPATGHWLQMPFGKAPRMVVAVDPANRLYGYTMQQPMLNLKRIFVSVIFQPWKEGNAFKNGNWSFYNDFYRPPVVLKSYFRAAWQAEAGGEEQAFTSSQVRAYAFLADSTDWEVASYDDAVAGRIVRKENPADERTTPNFQAYFENDSGLLGMEVTDTPLLAVVVDRLNRLYAYTKLDPDLTGEPPVWPLLFRPWNEAWKSELDGWIFVNQTLAPNP